MIEEEIARWRPHLSIVHHVVGRIRLRYGPAVLRQLPDIQDKQAERLLLVIEGIEDVRVNTAAASVIIEYDPRVIEPDTWIVLFQGTEDEAARVIRRLCGRQLENVPRQGR